MSIIKSQVVMKSSACPYIVQFYGGVFKEGDCWICMELMDASLDQFYKFVYRRMKQRMPENIIGKIALAVSMPTRFRLSNIYWKQYNQDINNLFSDCSSAELSERPTPNYPPRCKTK